MNINKIWKDNENLHNYTEITEDYGVIFIYLFISKNKILLSNEV